MTLQSPATDPLDRYSLAEWRTELCALLAISYAGQSAAWQTMFDSIVAETQDYLLKRSAGQPWGERETTDTVLTGTDTTYTFPDDFRTAIWLREESSSRVVIAKMTTKREYGFADQDYGTQHEWEGSDVPYYFFDGHDTSSPSAQQWRRIGVDNAGATLRIYYIPYLRLSTPELPASERAAARDHAMYKLKLLRGEYDAAAAFRQAREDEIAATETMGRGTVDAPMEQGLDNEMHRIFN